MALSLVVLLGMLGMVSPAQAQSVNDCRLADPNSLGEHVGTICWFQFGSVGNDLPSGTTGEPYRFNLPDGSWIELDVGVSGGTHANPRLTVTQAPTWTGSNFSGTSGFYTLLTPNGAALHSPDGRGHQAVLTLSDIRLFAPNGTEVTDRSFEIVVADAERLNSNPEYLDFGVVSGATPWTVLEWLGNAAAAAVSQGTPQTLDPGVASACLPAYVDCLRFRGNTGGSNANAVVLATRKASGGGQPFTVMGQIHSQAGQGFAVGVRWGSLRLRKVLPDGRADPADQFTYRVVNVNGQTVSTNTTSGAASGAYPWVGTMAMAGNVLTMIEEMAPGSVSTLDAYDRRIVCTRDAVVVLDQEYDPLSPPQLTLSDVGETVDCELTNTRLQQADLSITKTNNVDELLSGDETTYQISVGNAGPDAADGAVVRDPAVNGLDCTAGPLVCTASGGATCPASPTVAELQGAGVTIPTFPVGGTLEFTLTCTVTASGTP